MIRPNKTLSAFRDLVTIIGILVLCMLALQQFTDRLQTRRDEQARFAVVQNALGQLDAAYRQQIEAAKGDLNQIILRQNQMLLEYQKLLLATEFMPATVVRRSPTAAGQPQQPPAQGQPQSQPPAQPEPAPNSGQTPKP